MACRLFGAKPLPEPMLIFVNWTLRKKLKKKKKNTNKHLKISSGKWPFCPRRDGLIDRHFKLAPHIHIRIPAWRRSQTNKLWKIWNKDIEYTGSCYFVVKGFLRHVVTLTYFVVTFHFVPKYHRDIYETHRRSLGKHQLFCWNAVEVKFCTILAEETWKIIWICWIKNICF